MQKSITLQKKTRKPPATPAFQQTTIPPITREKTNAARAVSTRANTVSCITLARELLV